MFTPIHFRMRLNAHTSATATSAKAANSTDKTAPVASTLETLLPAARAACASVRDALHGAVDRLAQLFSKTTTSAPTNTTKNTTSPVSLTAAASTTRTASTTTRTASTTARTASTTTRTASTTTRTASTTANRTATTARRMASTTTRTRTATRAPAPRRLPTTRPSMTADERESIAEDIARANEPQSIASAMRSNDPPPPPPIEQLEREAMMFPASRPRHDYFARVANGAPAVASTPDLPTVFDDLLMPPHLAALPPAEARAHFRDYVRWPRLQALLAQARINLAVVRARDSPPPSADSSFACACGWCPDGTAAYPLCVALTMRRTMRSFGKRATTSHASDAARYQSATGHRRATAASIMAGARARA